ncbi:MAG: bifunctional (p)ppGpp synthetase/guanosine-3',5'-bis(diphosphate) 3'-pyrophosphohydrolase [Candidatus Kapabacteria bacterium]|nr:bifunctional (p)ppGpp synthetase/guanosine-3',5'-bis(diphosphate) 3'-pyrophosphohydrolase [Ignavibacteriota bacterium]MCW5884230.1 bifunctional (p)ppGpp synthetase/guanosine-3',5'-bis(diphosphate) 3'-pyrophosphohydrolase [Candidatus Kapabacteria bacterium]
MTENILDKLEKTAKNIYDTSTASFCNEIAIEIHNLKFDEESIAAAYFIKANTKDAAIRTILTKSFGEGLIPKIELLQRLGSISFPETQKNISGLRKLFIELTDDVRIIFIKLAERLVNLKHADKVKHDDILQLSEEALYFYSPIAQQLGIRKFYTELEDIAFKNLYEDDFNYLEKMIESHRNLFNTKINTMKLELQKVLNKYKINFRFQARVKRPYSIYRKIKKQRIPLEKIYDLLALRVIAESREECYMILGAVHNNWIPIEGRFRDWITFPKANGYRSIQTTVSTRSGDKYEIQIRTEEMHHEAEYGSSAHWAYKQGAEIKKNDWISRLREFLENDEYFDNPFAVFDKLKNEMKRDYINVLTPKGEIRSLPEGSTPLDYAFAVHTDLGYKTTGARVNGKFVSVKTELKSGDVIEIISSNNATPSRDWLNIVKTNRARSKVLRWFKKNEQDLLIADGKNTWEKLKSKHRRKLIGFEDEQKFKSNLAKIGYKSLDDYYYSIATGGVKCTLFQLKKLYPDAFRKQEYIRRGSSGTGFKEQKPQIRVEGLENIEVKLAKCCSPIKGEAIIAYITKKSELKIHSKNCFYIQSHEFEPENFKNAEWLVGEFIQIVNLKIFGDSYSKILSLVVDTADSLKVKILDTKKLSKGNVEGLNLEIEIKEIEQLNNFKNKLKNSKFVESIKN